MLGDDFSPVFVAFVSLSEILSKPQRKKGVNGVDAALLLLYGASLSQGQ